MDKLFDLPPIWSKKMNKEEFEEFMKEKPIDPIKIPIEQVEFTGDAVFGDEYIK